MTYNCTVCKYETRIKCNFDKHNKTQKHLANVKKYKALIPTNSDPPDTVGSEDDGTIDPSSSDGTKDTEGTGDSRKRRYKCPECGRTFTQSCNLSRHTNGRCPKLKTREGLEKEYHIDNLEKEIERLRAQLLERENRRLIDETRYKDQEIKYLKSLVDQAGSIAKTSVNALSYIHMNYKDAPLLEPINDYSIIKRNNENLQIEDILLHYYKDGKLVEYLGNILVAHYKKEDPSEQSIWNSDCTRLSYVIRKLVDDKPDWITDKKGIKLRESIIKPLLDYLKTIVQKHVSRESMRVNLTTCDLRSHVHSMEVSSNLVKHIEDSTVADDLVRYLAPYFYINK